MKMKETTWKQFFMYTVLTAIPAMFLAWLLPIKNEWLQCIPLIISGIFAVIAFFGMDKEKFGIPAIILQLISYFLFVKEESNMMNGLLFLLVFTSLLCFLVGKTTMLPNSLFIAIGIVGVVLLFIDQNSWSPILGRFFISLMIYRSEFEQYAKRGREENVWALVYVCLLWTVILSCAILI